jgi:hypothetical protein
MASKTDAVILALTAMWTAALTDINVVDGPQVTSDAASDWLFVGYNGDTPDEYNEGAIGLQSLMAFAKVKGDDGQVTCAVVSVSGDTDITATRARANGFLSAAEAAVRADMTLGGLVMHAFVSDYRYTPVQTQQGAKVRLVFTVTYKAQI